jgi:hypothetical protein
VNSLQSFFALELGGVQFARKLNSKVVHHAQPQPTQPNHSQHNPTTANTTQPQPQPQITNHKSQITNHKSQIKSQITNHNHNTQHTTQHTTQHNKTPQQQHHTIRTYVQLSVPSLVRVNI